MPKQTKKLLEMAGFRYKKFHEIREKCTVINIPCLLIFKVHFLVIFFFRLAM